MQTAEKSYPLLFTGRKWLRGECGEEVKLGRHRDIIGEYMTKVNLPLLLSSYHPPDLRPSA
jgi:hypothetical protein